MKSQIGYALIAVICCFVAQTVNLLAQQADEAIAQAPAESVIAERYLTVLRRSPRYGTAFDRVYGFQLAQGTFESLLTKLEAELELTSDGKTAMLIGMMRARHADLPQAQAAFRRAEELLPDEPLASYYLGKSLAEASQLEASIEAMQRAIARNPAKQDLLKICIELGRLFQRAKLGDEALVFWSELQQEFPDDLQILQQIAAALADAGQLKPAIERYQQLASLSRDPFASVEWSIRVAELRVKAGEREQAQREFEALLSKVNPDSWLHDKIRDSLDAIYLEDNDYDGLLEYYTQWVAAHPDDIDSMLRCGRYLSIARQFKPAESWFRKAIERVPSEPAPRLALVDALERDDRMTEAATAMRDLVQLDPSNVDHIVRWGRVVFSDPALDLPTRTTQAADIWRRLLESHPRDAIMVAQVADLFRGIGLEEEAIAQYRNAIEIAPEEPQYREYLGEYLQQLGRTQEALGVWREIAAGPRATRDNLVRLSEVYSTFKYASEALTAMHAACEQNPNLQHRLRLAKLLRQAERYPEALEQVALAANMAESDEERAQVWQEEIESLLATEQLQSQIDATEGKLASRTASGTVTVWQRLAVLHEAAQQGARACEAIDQAIQLAPGSIRSLQMAAELHEANGHVTTALEALQQLASLDRPSRSRYITQIASVQMRLGLADEALETARELIHSESSSSEQFRYYADLCYQAGKPELALETLRRGAHANPGDEQAKLDLAQRLANQYNNDEAIDLCWAAFDSTPTSQSRERIVELLTELHLRTDQYEPLHERIELFGRARNRKLEAVLLRALIHEKAGYYWEARELLEQVAAGGEQQLAILERLTRLALADDDWKAAAEYQQRRNQLAPSPEGEFALARLYVQQGDWDAAREVWRGLYSRQQLPEEYVANLSSLLNRGEFDRAAELAEQAVEQFPESWEIAAYALCAYHHATGRAAQASLLADALLAMERPFNEPKASASGNATATPSTTSRTLWLARAQQANLFLRTSQPIRSSSVGPRIGTNPFPLPAVECFGDARALAVLQKQLTMRLALDQRIDEAIKAEDRDELWELSLLTGGDPVLDLRVHEELVNLGETEAAATLLDRLIRFALQRKTIAQVRTSANSVRFFAALQLPPANQLEQVRKMTPLAPSLRNLIFAYELHLAEGLAEDAKDYMQQIREAHGSAAEMAYAATTLQALDPAFARELMLRALDELPNSPSTASTVQASALGLLSALLHEPASSPQPKELGAFVQRWLEIHGERVSQLRPSQLGAAAAVPYRVSVAIQSSPGVLVRTPSNITFPEPSVILPSEIIAALGMIHSSGRADMKAEIQSRLSAMSEQTENAWQRVVGLVCQSTWYWLSDARQQALDSIARAHDVGVGGEAIALLAAQMHMRHGDNERALKFLDALQPLHSDGLRERELAILEVAMKLGDSARAEQAARSLFTLNLDSPAQLQLAQTMFGLGMKDMGESIMTRLRFRDANELTTQEELLKHYQAKGDDAAAISIAKAILRRTRPDFSRVSLNSGRVVRRAGSTTARSQALSFLDSKQLLDELIQETKGRLETTPDSQRLKDQLAEFYLTRGDVAAARELRDFPSAVVGLGFSRTQANSTNSRFSVQQALQLCNAGQREAGLKLYVSTLQKDLSWVSELPRFRTHFDRASSWRLLAEVVLRNRQLTIPEPELGYMLQGLVKENAADVALNLLKNKLREDGLKSIYLVHQIISPFASAVNRSNNQSPPVRMDAEVAQIVVDQILKYSAAPQGPIAGGSHEMTPDGRMQSTLSTILKVLGGHDDQKQRLLAALTETPEDRRNPHHYLMLSMLHADAGRADEAASAFVVATKTHESIAMIGFDAVWEMGSILTLDFQQYEIVATGMGNALEMPPGAGINLSTRYALALFAMCCIETSQHQRAERVLDQLLARDPAILFAPNRESAAYMALMNSWAVSDSYFKIDKPLKALEAAAQALQIFSQMDVTSSYRRSAQNWNERSKKSISSHQVVGLVQEAVTGGAGTEETILKLAGLHIVASAGSSEPNIGCRLADIVNEIGCGEAEYEPLKTLVQGPLESLSNNALVALACFATTARDADGLERLAGELLRRNAGTASMQRSVSASDAIPQQYRFVWFAERLRFVNRTGKLLCELYRAAIDALSSEFLPANKTTLQLKLVDAIKIMRDAELGAPMLRQVLDELPDDIYAKYQVAWKISDVGQTYGLTQLSMDAAVAALANGPPLHAMSSTNTAGRTIYPTLPMLGSTSAATANPALAQVFSFESATAKSLLAMLEKWRASGASAEQLTTALLEIVIPRQQPEHIYLYSMRRDESATLVFDQFASDPLPNLVGETSVAGELLKVATESQRLEEVIEKAALRSCIESSCLRVAASIGKADDLAAGKAMHDFLVLDPSQLAGALHSLLDLVFQDPLTPSPEIFDVELLKKIPAGQLIESPRLQRLLIWRVHHAIRTHHAESLAQMIDVIADAYAYRTITRNQRLLELYDGVAHVAKQTGSLEIEKVYREKAVQLSGVTSRE